MGSLEGGLTFQKGLGAVHALSHELHPAKLQTLGLVAAINSICLDTSRQSGVRVEFSHDKVPAVVDASASLCLYRITQEALHNIVRHSQARHASVHLTSDRNFVYLFVADSGVGFDYRRVQQSGLGLVSMRERVGLLKGRLAVHTEPGAGTRIGVKVPFAANTSIRQPRTA